MNQQRKIFRVFLASPGDTKNERRVAEKVISELNRTVGSRDGFSLVLLKWETNTYASVGTYSQEVINRQIGDFDIFIGMMWKKFGTPTKVAGSGSEEEFNLAYERYLNDKENVNIMFYFNNSPIPQDANLEDFQKVKAFKDKIGGYGVYYFTYKTTKNFEDLLRGHLTLYVKDYLKALENKNEVSNVSMPILFEPVIKETFKLYLNDMEATFAHSNVDKVTIEDIYISPEIQKIEKKAKKRISKKIKLDSLVNAIEPEGIKYTFLGNELAGKTVCCKYLFKHYFEQDLIPILISGEDINLNIESSVIDKKISEQYENPFLLSSVNTDNVILIIDDFHKSAKGNIKYWEIVIKKIERKFKNVILTGSPLMLIEDEYKDPFKNFLMFNILEFGPVLRKALVHKWLTLNIDEKYIDKNDLLRKEDNALQHIKTAIGKNYFPVYPFYILSMLQAIEGNTVHNPNYSIHGFYYENLITRCFHKHIKNQKEINLYYNYLTYFCYFLFENQLKEISIKEFKEFHILYCKKVDITFSVEKIMETFDNASLLWFNGKVYIKEKYVYYFFTAKYLADNLNNDVNAKNVIRKMSIRIFRDDYANIILFVTHLSKDKFIIDELIKNADLIFSDVEPAKLEDEIKGINTLVETIPKQVLEKVNVDSKRMEELELEEEEEEEKYEIEYEKEVNNYNSFGLEDDISTIDFLAWVTMTFKTVDILGQIAKKHWGEMDRELKVKLITSTYNLGLRFLSYYLQLLQKNTDEFVEHLTKIFNNKSFKTQSSLKKSIEEETKDFLFRLCYLATFGTTKRISSAVSDTELKLTFNKVLQENPYNSIKLIDLSIKLIHSGLPIEHIKELKELMERNNLCTMVLQNLVIDHSFLYEITHKERSQINSIFGTDIKEQILLEKHY